MCSVLRLPALPFRFVAITLAFILQACGGGGSDGAPDGTSTTPQLYSVGGSVSGLSGSGLQLQNGGTTLSVAANGPFTFPAGMAAGTNYSVSVNKQPSNPPQTCTVSSAAGTVSANVTGISVTCTTNSYRLGGSVSGLAGTGLVLQDAGGTTVSIASNGAFSFAAPVPSGTNYSITIAAQPTNPGQTCTVSNGSGAVGSADIASVDIACATVITADTAASITTLGNTVSETLMQFASFMGERLTYLSSHLAPTVTETCSVPFVGGTTGSATYAFADNDGSGSLTPGDVVTITLAGCYSPSMADYVAGTVTLTLVTPSNPSNGGLSFAATAALNPLQLSGLQISGSFHAEYASAETLSTVLTTVGSQPVTFSYQQSGGWFPADTVSVSNVAVSKTIDYTMPRYSVEIAADYQSQRLNGTFSVSTPTTLSGRLGIYPDTGMEVFSGGPSVLHYAAQNVSNNEWVVASLDQSGSGNFVDLGNTLFWEQGVNGFPWWEPRGASIVSPTSRPSYTTWQLGMWQMGLMFTEPVQADPINQILSTGLDVDTPIKMFFNGPVDPASAVFIFNTAGYFIPGQVAVPAVATVNGPIVTVTASSQLQHGETYTLASEGRVATTWPTSGVGSYVDLKLTTLNNLEANGAPSPGVAAPGQSVQLHSAGSFSTNSTIAGYSWSQTGGTQVTLSGANTASASFVVPATSQSGDSLRFSLTITDANGETDTVPVTAFVMTELTQPFLYYRAQQVASVGQEPEDATLESSANGTVTTLLDTSLNIFRYIFNGPAGSGLFDELQFQPGESIAPGTYTSSNTPTVNPLFLSSFQCNANPTWQLKIYEAVAAPDGTAAKFSADFTLSCPGGGQPPYSGSIRVNSSVPLP